ncbi:MAG: DUF3244 domain-containing protein [Paludibacter sp.]|nr:DUF3244 domain-containing protein [Paludibacter sp.]
MKKLNLFNMRYIIVGVIAFFSFQCLYATNYFPLQPSDDDPQTADGTRTSRIPVYIPVTASIDDAELGIFFDDSVGDATIQILDEDGAPVYTEVVDTDMDSEFYFNLDFLDFGYYTIVISYGNSSFTTDQFWLEY